MGEPILLLHGYSAETSGTSASAIRRIYGTLPDELERRLGASVTPLNLARFVTLEDGVTLDDLARAMDSALRQQLPRLVGKPASLNVVTHSTGALVARAWLLRHSPAPGPCARLVHLAGAFFGSGWAHLGRGQLARWGRLIFQGGTESGLQLLRALELGCPETLDLQLALAEPGKRVWKDLRVREACLAGTQSELAWLPVPIKYIKEDGADGVLRVPAANPNYVGARLVPTRAAQELDFAAVQQMNRMGAQGVSSEGAPAVALHRLMLDVPGDADRPLVPMTIPFQTAHSGSEMGIVAGKLNRAEVLEPLVDALTCATDDASWADLAARFEARTQATLARAARELGGGVLDFFDPREQYDQHAMLVFRLRDQDGRPVEQFDVYLDSGDVEDPDTGPPMSTLFEDNHKPQEWPGMIVFYLRCLKFDTSAGAPGSGGGWVDRLGQLGSCHVHITAMEPRTDRIAYVPLRLKLGPASLRRLVQPGRTTIVDVTMRRVAAGELFRIV